MQYHDLQKMKVQRLRELAAEDPTLEGVSGMKKVQLLDLLSHRMGIEKPHMVAEGDDKAALKARIREVKRDREAAIAAHDEAAKRRTRDELHRLRHALHRTARVHA